MNIYIEQIRPELTWRLRQQVLYPAQKLHEMELDEDNYGIHFGAFTEDKFSNIKLASKNLIFIISLIITYFLK